MEGTAGGGREAIDEARLSELLVATEGEGLGIDEGGRPGDLFAASERPSSDIGLGPSMIGLRGGVLEFEGKEGGEKEDSRMGEEGEAMMVEVAEPMSRSGGRMGGEKSGVRKSSALSEGEAGVERRMEGAAGGKKEAGTRLGGG